MAPLPKPVAPAWLLLTVPLITLRPLVKVFRPLIANVPAPFWMTPPLTFVPITPAIDVEPVPVPELVIEPVLLAPPVRISG